MWELFVSLFLLNGVEGIFYVLACTRFKVRNVKKLDLFLCWFFITVLNYTITRFITIPIPLLNQIILFAVGSILVSVILNIKITKVSLGFVITIVVLVLVEGISAGLYSRFFDINLMAVNLNWSKFLLFIPIRPIEFITLYSTYFLINRRCCKDEDMVGRH